MDLVRVEVEGIKSTTDANMVQSDAFVKQIEKNSDDFQAKVVAFHADHEAQKEYVKAKLEEFDVQGQRLREVRGIATEQAG